MAGDDRAARGIVALYQQNPLGERVPGMRPCQETHTRHVGHVVVDDQKRNRFVLVGQLAEAGEPTVG